ncbi:MULTISPECIES: hypothetical protein [Bacillaceae]|uniref:Nuclear transport factor 2 family protein n=1 Tax=Alkalicoccobacillus plakortidis TaxID=444060 RepID=A0A9D5DN87_9BACI|nr:MULTISPECIES: hypothetical protein [Bacillaceae]KQL57217.1 hypothetical protein AN965_09980 [Alkalicoccobacillus plakortidis]
MNLLNNVNIEVPTGCDNAPRKKILIDLTLAFIANDANFISETLSPSSIWRRFATNEEIAGVKKIVIAADNNYQKPNDIKIESVITHGKFASIDGVVHYTDGSSLYFCDVFVFTSASNKGLVKEIKSYHLKK